MSAPKFSVVLASCRPQAVAESSIRSLSAQCERVGAELIVARPGTDGTDAFPVGLARGRVVRCDPGASLPTLRAAGLGAATGDWVALTEDNCVASGGWLEALAGAATPAVDILGGVMGNARCERAIDWGAFFAEYGFYGASRPAPRDGELVPMTCANVAYSRAVLPEVIAVSLAGEWEDSIHARLAARGARFDLVPAARVDQQLSYRLGEFCRDRFIHGRTYATVRNGHLGIGARCGLVLAIPALPVVLAWRVWLSAGRASPGAFGRALPATLAFLGAWSLGEAVGYLRGRAE